MTVKSRGYLTRQEMSKRRYFMYLWDVILFQVDAIWKRHVLRNHIGNLSNGMEISEN